MAPKKRTIIEKSQDNQHPDRVIVEESIEPKDQPSVMAYRLGALEDAVRTQTSRFDELVKGFITEKEFSEAKQSAEEEHARIWASINSMKSSVRWYIGTAIALSLAIATWVTITRNG
jgi:hypothetical protein